MAPTVNALGLMKFGISCRGGVSSRVLELVGSDATMTRIGSRFAKRLENVGAQPSGGNDARRYVATVLGLLPRRTALE